MTAANGNNGEIFNIIPSDNIIEKHIKVTRLTNQSIAR